MPAGIPILNIFFCISISNLNGNIFFNFIILLPLNKTNIIIKVPISLAIAIATAAPAIPNDGMLSVLIPNINVYPKAIFIRFINIVICIGVFVSPHPLSIPLAICSIAINGYVSKVNSKYSFASILTNSSAEP